MHQIIQKNTRKMPEIQKILEIQGIQEIHRILEIQKMKMVFIISAPQKIRASLRSLKHAFLTDFFIMMRR